NLFEAAPETHEMFCDQLCTSEYPLSVAALGRTKDIWKERRNNPDNEWFDGGVGCMALSSFCGARLDAESPPPAPQKKRMSLREAYEAKHGRHGRR
ncbi:MAG: hypothetical protein KDA71_16135, partial [Planctomycetales bacterium]|nr:hypothetical protein [Planctomycetales bacterium]